MSNKQAILFGEKFEQLIGRIANEIRTGDNKRGRFGAAVETVARELAVSPATIQKWREGKYMPADRETTGTQLVQYGVRMWGMDHQWANAILTQLRHPERDKLLKAIFEGRSFKPPTILESAESPVPADSPFYIKRAGDDRALNEINRQCVTITINGPAKIGKTSLLHRVEREARKIGKQTIYLNFREFGRQTLRDENAFFLQFCHCLNEKLALNNEVEPSWNQDLSNPLNCGRYVKENVLKELDQRLVLILENVDAIFGVSFQYDFFGMLRSWHEEGQFDKTLNLLDRVLVVSTVPYQFMDETNTGSPFNIGTFIDLKDFTFEQVAQLNKLYDSPMTANELQNLMKLLNGHPYLTRQALNLISEQEVSVSELLSQATADDGPFRKHLNELWQNAMKGDLRQALQSFFCNQTPPDDNTFFRLRGAGLVRKEGKDVLPRCRLYANFFRERLCG